MTYFNVLIWNVFVAMVMCPRELIEHVVSTLNLCVQETLSKDNWQVGNVVSI